RDPPADERAAVLHVDLEEVRGLGLAGRGDPGDGDGEKRLEQGCPDHGSSDSRRRSRIRKGAAKRRAAAVGPVAVESVALLATGRARGAGLLDRARVRGERVGPECRSTCDSAASITAARPAASSARAIAGREAAWTALYRR